jgi:hypothetical protein
MKKAIGLGIIGAFIFSLATPVLAQEAQFKRKTVLNFEDDTIEGDLKTPDGVYLQARKKNRHKSLIRIRKDWRRKVLSSVGEL